MDGRQIKMGDEVTVLVYRNKEGIAQIVSQAVSDDEMVVNVFLESDRDLAFVSEALEAARGAIDYHAGRPGLRKMLEDRIAELKKLEDEEEGEPPYPIDVGDIPF